MNSVKYFLTLFIFLALVMISPLYAGDEVLNVRSSGSAIQEGLLLSVVDDKYEFMETHPSGASSWKNSFDNDTIINRMILSIDQTSKVYQPAAYSVEVELVVTYDIWDDATNSFKEVSLPANPVLTVTYSPDAPYQDKSIFQFEGGNKFEARIVRMTPSPSNAVMNLALDCELEVKRYYNFDITQVPAAGHNDGYVLSRGELEVYWGFVPGAEEYELEWTHVNNYDTDNTPLAATDITLDPNLFKFNSTRVNTYNNYYRIPLIYENGYILYRVRAVGRSAADKYEKNLYSKWSSDGGPYAKVSDFPSKYLMTAHQKNLNWQNSVSFAEEGKNKVAVSYFDGSLRNRQVVSRINSEDKTIVGETIYDHQGRGAVQVLPVPQSDPKIGYKPNLNRNSSDDPYTKADFDTDTDCEPAPDSMKSTSGASRYYNPMNLDKTAENKYLPDAKGYPFTQVEYTPDNTGRIRRQSGVGVDHKLGSGHETRYFYGKPTLQEELDRLFGAEVGPMERYKKNMVIDANGQVSVSYLDPQGRVIATALAGKAPGNLDSLNSTFKTIGGDLLNKADPDDNDGNLQHIEGFSKTYTSEMLVTSRGYRNFEYKLHNDKFIDTCLASGQRICYDCVLELEILLTDECQNQYLVGLDGVSPTSTRDTIGKEILAAIRNGNYTPVDCDAASGLYTAPEDWEQTNAIMEPGNYTISKILTVNKEALDFYVNDYIYHNACLIPLDSFIVDELKQIDTLSCHITCEQCLERLGDYDQYDVNVNADCDPCLTEQEYLLRKSECDELCDDSPLNCESAFQNMLMDVRPFGQYGGIVTEDGEFYPEIFPLSTLNIGNALPRRREFYDDFSKIPGYFWTGPNWKNPITYDLNEDLQSHYYDELGNIALVEVKWNEVNSRYEPEIDGRQTPVQMEDQYFVEPQFLKNASDFSLAWKETWAQSLVRYHPEYYLYEYCQDNMASHIYDDELLNKLDSLGLIPAADRLNYYHPLGDSPAEAFDPYFSSDPMLNKHFSQSEYDAMDRSMKAYTSNSTQTLSIWQMAYVIANCPNYNPNGPACAPDCIADFTTPEASFGEAEWDIFRSLYHSLKQKFQEQKMIQFAINNNSYNGCMGEDRFNPYKDNFARYIFDMFPGSWGFRWWRSQYYNWQQPCSVFQYWLYRDKTARFPRANQGIDTDAMDAYACYDEDSNGEFEKVNCPAQSLAIMDELEDKADFEFFEDCGQCSVTKDLENLLNAIAKNTHYNLNDDFKLSCYPDSEFPEWVSDLETAMGLSGGGDVFWNTNESITSAVDLEVIIHNSSSVSRTLKINMLTDYTIPDNSNGTEMSKTFTWEDIQEICCVNYVATTNPSTMTFSFDAKVIVTYADQTEHLVKIPLTGSISGLDINPATCPKPLICNTSKGATDLQTLLNMLITNYPSDHYIDNPTADPYPAKNNDLLSTVTLDPQTPPYDQTLVDSLKLFTGIGSNLNPDEYSLRWTATTGSGVLHGKIQGVQGSGVFGECVVELDMPVDMPAGATFLSIQDFHGIHADRSNADPEHYFKIFGLVTYFEGSVQKQRYVEFSGYSPCIKISECMSPVFKGKDKTN